MSGRIWGGVRNEGEDSNASGLSLEHGTVQHATEYKDVHD